MDWTLICDVAYTKSRADGRKICAFLNALTEVSGRPASGADALQTTPEGLCTRCSATGYCSEHEPLVGADALTEATTAGEAIDAGTHNLTSGKDVICPKCGHYFETDIPEDGLTEAERQFQELAVVLYYVKGLEKQRDELEAALASERADAARYLERANQEIGASLGS